MTPDGPPRGPRTWIRPRVAQSSSPAWNATKTLAQIAVMWAVFFGVLPTLVCHLERSYGVPRLGSTLPGWVDVASIGTFAVVGACATWLGVMLAVRGDGTPLPFDTARKLVIAGPYRYVRNPMAMLSFAQGACVAVVHRSAAVALYVACGVAIWQFVARGWEEADLAARFGAPYERYRRRVRCWRIRVLPYDPTRDADEPPISTEATTPPGRNVVLYDGNCRLCVAASARLVRLARPGTMERRNFRDVAVLDAFPGVTPEACEVAMHLVLADGRVFAGAEAAARAFGTRPVLGVLARLYYVPGVRQLADVVYRWIARNRFRWFGRASHCDDGTCKLR